MRRRLPAGATERRQQRPQRWQGSRWAVLLAITVLAAVCFIGIKIGLAYAPPLAFAGLRALLAGVVLLTIAAARRDKLLPERRDCGPLVLLALTATTATYGAMFGSPAQMGAGLAAVLGNVQPLLVVVLGAAFLGEQLTRGKLLALAAGITGVGLILYPSLASSASGIATGATAIGQAALGGTALGGTALGGTALGGLLALVASAGTAVGSVIVKRIRVRPGIVALTGWQLTLGSLPLLAAAAAQPGAVAIQWNVTFVLVLLFLALLGTALPTTLWFWLLQGEDAGRLSMFLFLIPVLGLPLGAITFGERVGVVEAVGTGVITLGLVAVSREMRRPGRQVPPRTLGEARVAGERLDQP